MINYEVRYKLCHIWFIEGVNKEPELRLSIDQYEARTQAEYYCWKYKDVSKQESEYLSGEPGYFFVEYLKRVEE